jgi:hypothetical protein
MVRPISQSSHNLGGDEEFPVIREIGWSFARLLGEWSALTDT